MEKKVIDQKEYLKKYLSSGTGDDKKKKKKKKPKTGAKTVKIIDDDIDLKNMRPIADHEFDIFIDGEDAPQIAGIVDERGPIDFSDQRRWRIISNDQDGDLTISQCRDSKQSKIVTNEDDDSNVDTASHKSRKDKKKMRVPDSEVSSPGQNRNENYDSDLSPPRKSSRKNYDSDLSPPRKSKNRNYDSDLSLPRKSKNKNYDSDLSPPRKTKSKNYDSDLSPPRKTKSKNYDSDFSPPRKTKSKNYDSDLSPPRKTVSKNYDSDLSPPRKTKSKNYDSNLSPPRRNKKHKSEKATKHANKSDSDLSPPRRSKKDEYEKKKSNIDSRKHRKNSDSDLSPPRKSEKYMNLHVSSKQRYRNDDPDLSPHRQSGKHKHGNPHALSKVSKSYKHFDKSSWSERRHNSDTSPPRRKNRDRSRSKSMEDSRNLYKSKKKGDGKYQYEDSYRKEKRTRDVNDYKLLESNPRDDKSDSEKRMKKTLDGKQAGLQNARALREETEAHKKREAEHFSKLSKEITGVGQAAIVRDTKTGRKRNLEAEAAEEREKQKRQAELNEKYAKWGKGLKQVEDREEKLKDDLYEMSKPLARYADDADLDKRLREQEREGDPMLEYIKQKQIKEGKRKPDRPTYEGSYMPNRFGIKPGYRWDGVDRSNGYEKRWFESQNAKTALQEEAYKWSTSDM
ncbi:uncharacterized protein LOC116433597 isoform X2 [Nomia melanderi]|uniref:uncharacterized protein LOC116433597 isoform X2 n=1 Tax=Nomia melanderi TaxID=2448451 RepID=UPI001304686B|nr:BUD13 homolog isoform X2 [Nomia melanderi]